MDNKVSVIVPFYNTPYEYLKKCINSILNQTNQNFEILIVNDGSDAEHSKFLNEFENTNKVRIIHKQNGGVSSARNIGLASANGDWCMFVDSDDWLCNDCIDSFLSVCKDSEKFDYIVSKVNLVNGDKICENENKIKESGPLDKITLIKNIVINQNPELTCIEPVWAKMYNIQFLSNNNLYFDTKLRSGEDVVFNLKCAEHSNNVYYLNKSTYNYSYNSFSECRTCKDISKKTTLMLKEIDKTLEKSNNNIDGYYDYYVLRAISRLLRKQFANYQSASKFAEDFGKIMNEPEYQKVISNPNTKYFEPAKLNLINLCKQQNYIEIFDSLNKGAITK